MPVLDQYRDARRDEDIARLRRVIALRAMVAAGRSQRQIAESLGISQPAVSQQLKSSPDLDTIHPEVLLEAAARDILVRVHPFQADDRACAGTRSRPRPLWWPDVTTG